MVNRPQILPSRPGQQEFLERLLTGSQAKTAYALRYNSEEMIRRCPGGLESIGFMTLTVGDETGEEYQDSRGETRKRFVQIFDSSEASRRINNLNRRLLPDIFEKWIVVTERHANKAIHFHILGVLRGFPDIRTGVNFAEIERRDYRNVPQKLRALWELLRQRLPEYGFGRAELLPVKKTGEAVASYISKYIEKNVCNRLKQDAHKKLVRYCGWGGRQLKPNEFGWGTQRAAAWRGKARTLAGLIGITEPGEAAQALGRTWAWTLTRLWQRTLGDDLMPGFTWTWRERELLRAELARAGWAWARKKDGEKSQFSRNEMPGFYDNLPGNEENPQFRRGTMIIAS